jgi:hypothetical protein
MDQIVEFASTDHSTEDVSMQGEVMTQLPSPELEIENVRVRQFLAREIFKRYQFNCIKVEFSKETPNFVVKKTQTGPVHASMMSIPPPPMHDSREEKELDQQA